ncbi:MAG: hypothetical protein HC936_19570 [Leptolyngbyaceae cyanobacterium SU_3_3]|nr:hypothetical protein [Leptolyngbyaceae cyanobacterium SU_3_3]
MTISFVATHDRTHADYQQQWDTLVPKGYRPISISVYGQRSNPLYAAVWVQRPSPALQAFMEQMPQRFRNFLILGQQKVITQQFFL